MKPITNLLLISLALVVTGCRVITFSQTSPEGVKTSVTLFQAFTKTDAYSCSLTATNASLEAYKSGVDGKALGVAVGAAVKAAMMP